MNKIAYACISAASLLAAMPANAQTAAAPDASAAPVGDVVVTANRTAQRMDRVGSSIAVLTEEAIEAKQTVAVVDLLASTPGVSFTSNGGMGKATSLNIRGSENQHTVVLIDGVKLNDPSSTQGGFNFGNLMVGSIARIEVLRGAQSTLWGSQAIGGVVNVITAQPKAPLEGSIDAEGGSYSTAMVRAGIGGAGDQLSWRLSASQLQTSGFSAFAAGAEADGYRNLGLSGRLNYAFTDAVSVDLRATRSAGRSDFDGFGVDSREYGETTELVSYAGLNFDLFDGIMKNRVGYAYTDTKRQNFNPATLAQPMTFDATGENKRFEYQGTLTFTEDLNATFGAETETSEMKTRSPSAFAPNPAYVRGEASIDTVYGQAQWTILGGLTLTGGLRYDDHATFGDNTLGQVAAAWSLNEGATVFRTSFGQGFRAPSLYELYSEYGNLTLQPESFDSWEVGVEQKLLDRAVVTVAYFNREGENEIRYNGCSIPTTDPLCRVNGVSRWGYYLNVQKTKAQGVELFGNVQVTDRLSLDANYTWTEAQSGSGATAGKQLTRRPEHMANGSISYRWPGDFSTSVTARYVGKTFDNAANTSVVKAYTLIDLLASKPLTDGFEIYARVQNAFDEQYQSILNYGTADRAAYFGIRARF